MEEVQTMPQTNTMEPTPTVPVMPAASQPMANSPRYAGFLVRLVAAVIDWVIMIVLQVVVIGIFGGEKAPGYVQLILMVIQLSYYVGLTSMKGATVGKMVMKLRVQKEDTGANLTIVDAVLREVVGKFISLIVFFVGFLAVLWDPKKQGWHDKIAKTVVVFNS